MSPDMLACRLAKEWEKAECSCVDRRGSLVKIIGGAKDIPGDFPGLHAHL